MDELTKKLLLVYCLTLIAVGLDAVAVDGDWTPWSALFSECSKSCGGGIQQRIRTCTNPAPIDGGITCKNSDGADADTEVKNFDCNIQSCWDGTFSDWSNCSLECNIGTQFREAMCGNETCLDHQAKKEVRNCNTWDIDTCPSPCKGHKCPKYGLCKDESTKEKPVATCYCTMGYNLEGGRCVRPPPTKPTERPIPTLPRVTKIVATVLTKTASTVLITCVTITLVFFIIMKIFTNDRVIQMNMEIALLAGHLLLLFPSTTSQNELLCKIISILLHLVFTAVFAFMLLEALHMYSLVANVVKKDGMFTRTQNVTIGWGISLFIVLFTMCFEYENYGGLYHCWVQLNKGVSLGEQIPIIVMMIITFTLIEAAGNTDDFKKLENQDPGALMSAKFSQRTNLILLPLVYVHWILGALSEYQQNIALYSIFSAINALLGVMVMVLHCSNNQEVRKRMLKFFGKCCGKKKNTDMVEKAR